MREVIGKYRIESYVGGECEAELSFFVHATIGYIFWIFPIWGLKPVFSSHSYDEARRFALDATWLASPEGIKHTIAAQRASVAEYQRIKGLKDKLTSSGFLYDASRDWWHDKGSPDGMSFEDAVKKLSEISYA